MSGIGRQRRWPRWMSGAALVALTPISALGAQAASASQADYQQAYKLGLRAYKYGLPLLSTQQTYRTATSVKKPTHRAYAPPNRFSQAHKLANPNARTVVAPNHDTLYSIGWLNLKRQPVVIHVPKVKDRYYVSSWWTHTPPTSATSGPSTTPSRVTTPSSPA